MAFYLSEMAVSDGHGGGLTLQRVLGEDLPRFDKLVSVGWFGRAPGPAPKLAQIAKQIDLPLDALPARTHLLRYFKSWLRRRPFIHRWEMETTWHRLRRIIGHNRPRLLVCPQGSLSVWLTARAVRELGAEYITWVMDDHPLKDGGSTMRYDPHYEPQWSEHLSRARKVFVISEAMKEFYHERFGVESEVLHGAVSLHSAPYAESNCQPRRGRLRLGYAGSLGGWQRDPLELLAKAVRSCDAELHVAGHGAPRWLKEDAVVLLGQVPPNAVQDMLAQCDAVVLPVSFTPEHAAMSRLNVATKLSELCASGRPILAIGPADAAMIRMLATNEAAVCVMMPARQDLVVSLSKLRDPDVSNRVVANARRLFEEELNLEEMQRRWKVAGGWLFASDAS